MPPELPAPIALFYRPVFFCRCLPNQATGHKPGTPNLQPQVKLWIRHPAEINYDDGGAFPICLSNTPLAHVKMNISHHQIHADDHTHNNGYTTIGPAFPHAYGAGGIYVSKAIYDQANELDQAAWKTHQQNPYRALDAKIDDTVIVAFKQSSDKNAAQIFDVVRYHGFYGKQLFPPYECTSNPRGGSVWIVWNPGTWPGATANKQWHPPQKLWVPDAVRPLATEMPTDDELLSNPPDDSRIFLEQSYALYTAQLCVPKQPSGCSDDGSATSIGNLHWGAAAPPAHPQIQQRRNLNVISDYAPGELGRIKQQFGKRNFLLINEGETLVDALSAYVSRLRAETPAPSDPLLPPELFENLDLIGHSRSRDHVLKLGENILTSAAAREQFGELDARDILDALGVKAVRLLGCRTAAHPRGEKVVQAIKDATVLKVYATRGDLFAVHYDRHGLRPEAELLLADDDVILTSGAGDLPPNDDFLPRLPSDDPDDPEDDAPPTNSPQPPDRFSLAALSDANASRMSADNYLWWDWTPEQLAELVDSLYADWCTEDNPLMRAEYEVLLPISKSVSDISDVRSFDLFLRDSPPRIRVNRGDKSFIFHFRRSADLAKVRHLLGI